MKSKLFQNQVFKRQNFLKLTLECNVNIKLESDWKTQRQPRMLGEKISV